MKTTCKIEKYKLLSKIAFRLMKFYDNQRYNYLSSFLNYKKDETIHVQLENQITNF